MSGPSEPLTKEPTLAECINKRVDEELSGYGKAFERLKEMETSNPLVERLRHRIVKVSDYSLPDKDCHDAADEIERLVRENEELKRQLER